MVRSLQLITMPPRSPPPPSSSQSHTCPSLFSLLLTSSPSHPSCLSPSVHSSSSLFPPLSFSARHRFSPSLDSFLPSSLLPHFSPCLGALMVSMYSSSDTVTSAGREGLSLTTQPANEIFPHLINTIRILILTESI